MKLPKRFRLVKPVRWMGVFLLLAGLQLHVVESYTSNKSSTRQLVNWWGAPEDTPQGMIQRFVVDSTSQRATITPPLWVGRCVLSFALVALAYGYLGRKWR